MEVYVRIWPSTVTPRFYVGSVDHEGSTSQEYVSVKFNLDNYRITKIVLTISLSKSLARRINLTWNQYLEEVLTDEVMENMRQNFLRLTPDQQTNLNGIKVPGVGLSHYFNIFYLELTGVMALLAILSYSQDALGNPLEPLNPAFPAIDITPELITQQTGTYLFALCQGLTKIPVQTLGAHLAHLTQGFFSTFGSTLIETNDHCSMFEVSSANLEAMASISCYYSSDVKYIGSQIETVRRDLNLVEHCLEEYRERIGEIDSLAHQRQKMYFSAGFTKIIGMSVQASHILHTSLKSIKADMEEHQKRIYQYINRISMEQVDGILAAGRQQSMALSGQLHHYQEEMIKLGQSGEQALINQKEQIKQLVSQAGEEAKQEAEQIKTEIGSQYQEVHQKTREEVVKLQNKWKELLYQMEQEVKMVETGCKEELKQEQLALQQNLVEQQRACIASIQEHTRLLLVQQQQVIGQINQIVEQSETNYRQLESKMEQYISKTLSDQMAIVRQEMETFLSDRIDQLEQRLEQQINTRLSQEALKGNNEALIKSQIDKMIKQQWESVFNNKLSEVDKRLKTANLIYQQSLLVNEQSSLLGKNIPKTTVVKANVINDGSTNELLPSTEEVKNSSVSQDRSTFQEHIPDLLGNIIGETNITPIIPHNDNPYKPGITVLSGKPSSKGKISVPQDSQKIQLFTGGLNGTEPSDIQMVRYAPALTGKISDQTLDNKPKRLVIPGIQTVN